MKKIISSFLFVFVLFAFACNQTANYSENLSASQYQSFVISNVFGGKANPNKVDAPEITQDMLPGDSQAISALTGENALLLSSPRPFSISMSKVNWDGNVFCSKIENGKVVDIKWDGSSISAFNYDDTYFIYLRGENNTTITAGDFYSFLIVNWESNDESLGQTITFTGNLKNLVDCLDAENVVIDERTLKSFLSYVFFMDTITVKMNITGLSYDDNDDMMGSISKALWILWEDGNNYYYLDNFDATEVLSVSKNELTHNVAKGAYSSIPYLVAPNYGIEGATEQIVDTWTYKNGGEEVFRDARTYYPTGNTSDEPIINFLKNRILSNNESGSFVIKSDSPFNISFSKNPKTWDGEIEYVLLNETERIESKVWSGEKIEAQGFNGEYYVFFKGKNNTTITNGSKNNHFIIEGTGEIAAYGDIRCLLSSANPSNVSVGKYNLGGLFFEQNIQIGNQNIDVTKVDLFGEDGLLAQYIGTQNIESRYYNRSANSNIVARIIWFDRMSDDVEYKATIYDYRHVDGYSVLGDNSTSNISYDDFSTAESLIEICNENPWFSQYWHFQDKSIKSCWVRDEAKTKVGLFVLAIDPYDSDYLPGSILDISIDYLISGEKKSDKFSFNYLSEHDIRHWMFYLLDSIKFKFDSELDYDWWHVIYANNLKVTVYNYSGSGSATLYTRYTAGTRSFWTSTFPIGRKYGGVFNISNWHQSNITVSSTDLKYTVKGTASDECNTGDSIYSGTIFVKLPLGYETEIKLDGTNDISFY